MKTFQNKGRDTEEQDSCGLVGETRLPERVYLNVQRRVLHILSDTRTERLLGIEPELANKRKLQLLRHMVKRCPSPILIFIQLSVRWCLV